MPRLREYDFLDLVQEHLPEILSSEAGFERVRFRNPKSRAEQQYDIILEGRVAGQRVQLLVEAKGQINSAVIDQAAKLRDYISLGKGQILVLAAPRIGAKYQRLLQERGISYADLAGNIFLSAPGVLVKIEGGELPHHLRPPRRKNPFADKASLILRVLFADRQRSWGIRELAREAGVAVGWASDIAKVLEQRFYVSRDENSNVLLEDPILILEDWSHFYSYRKNRVVSFLSPSKSGSAILKDLRLSLEDLRLGGSHAYSLLVAINLLFGYVRSDQIHLYIAAEKFESAVRALQSRLQLHRVSEGGNIHLMRPYYRSSFMFGSQRRRNVEIVSDIQLYLDLVDFPARGREAAELLVKKRLGPSLDIPFNHYKKLLSA